MAERRDTLECSILLQKQFVLVKRERHLPGGTRGDPGQLDELILVLHRQPPHHDLLEHREHGARHPDPETEDQHRGDGEGGCAAEGTDGIPEVAADRVKHRLAPPPPRLGPRFGPRLVGGSHRPRVIRSSNARV